MKHLFYFTKSLQAFAGKNLYFNLIGMVLISILEGVGIVLLIPMISTIGILSVNIHSTPIPAMHEFLDKFPKTLSLSIILCTYILLVLGQGVIQKKVVFNNIKIQIGFINNLRLETYQILLEANWAFLMKKRKSDLINSLTDELGRVSAGTNLFLQLITSIIFTMIQLGVALWLSAKITLFVLVSSLILAYFSKRFVVQSRVLGGKTTKIAKKYLGEITDNFNGIKEIKSNILEESRIGMLRSWCQEIEKEKLEQVKLKNNSQFFYKFSSAILIAILIFLSVEVFKANPEQLLLIILIFSRLWPRFSGIQSNVEQIASNLPAFTSIRELQEESILARELKESELIFDIVHPMVVYKGIECKNICFRYNCEEEIYAIKNASFKIFSNTMTAVVGQSGAGKSTLIDIIMGLLQPEKGTIIIDEKPLSSSNLFSFRKSISYVPQDPFLFNGSIRENLLMMEPNSTEEQIWEALELSSVASFVRQLPLGLDTTVGDRGVRLSGGERQRLVLARALLRNPSILVLDEATSSLDTENEFNIQEAIERLKGKMTIIVIAHRLSTIRNADHVIVLDNGEIVQQGQYNQLAHEKKGVFNTMLRKQMEVSV
ncbi:ABC transporter ATP-binding protein [Neobacillus drentensis]|uniref:ABC transporter ATP-binding protein n=1 Tax=Neobacillus drentensis TaxID=220684 RepID=UPI002FFEA81F